MSGNPLSPMMQQYHEAKRAAGDALLLFRMGDFYELFFEDAKIAARTLCIALTSRDKGDDPVPMAGFPYHSLDGYLKKLVAAGHRAGGGGVCICSRRLSRLALWSRLREDRAAQAPGTAAERNRRT